MTYTYTRILKMGMSGDDVRYMKNCLFELKMFSSGILRITNSTFGLDTFNAVKKFQTLNKAAVGNLVDGKIGPLTWKAIVAAVAKLHSPVFLLTSEFPNLNAKTIEALNAAWQGVSQVRINMMKLCIKHGFDMVNNVYVKGAHLAGMYIIGANLYDTNDNLFHPTASYIQRKADAAPGYFDDGREAFMLKEIAFNPQLAASDCSGMLIGALRKLNLVVNTFDSKADYLSTMGKYSVSISKEALKPGDWVAKTGHIGMYLGAGLVVEFAGGAYGCQITPIANRKLRNLITGELQDVSEWTRFRDPIYY